MTGFHNMWMYLEPDEKITYGTLPKGEKPEIDDTTMSIKKQASHLCSREECEYRNHDGSCQRGSEEVSCTIK